MEDINKFLASLKAKGENINISRSSCSSSSSDAVLLPTVEQPQTARLVTPSYPHRGFLTLFDAHFTLKTVHSLTKLLATKAPPSSVYDIYMRDTHTTQRTKRTPGRPLYYALLADTTNTTKQRFIR